MFLHSESFCFARLRWHQAWQISQSIHFTIFAWPGGSSLSHIVHTSSSCCVSPSSELSTESSSVLHFLFLIRKLRVLGRFLTTALALLDLRLWLCCVKDSTFWSVENWSVEKSIFSSCALDVMVTVTFLLTYSLLWDGSVDFPKTTFVFCTFLEMVDEL